METLSLDIFRQYHEDVKAAAKAFIKLGLKPFHGVGILGFNSPEWHIRYTWHQVRGKQNKKILGVEQHGEKQLLDSEQTGLGLVTP